MKNNESQEAPGQPNENSNNVSDQTWGRTNNEAYIWENEGEQEHHDNPENEVKDHGISDIRIQKDIHNLLTTDNFIDASNVDVTVKAGEAILSGTVSEANDKQRAESLAAAVAGVMKVENQLTVQLN
ncbi:hypothetical protein BH09BAC3_BH09BAC3_16110 [soil metagenome]